MPQFNNQIAAGKVFGSLQRQMTLVSEEVTKKDRLLLRQEHQENHGLSVDFMCLGMVTVRATGCWGKQGLKVRLIE